MSKFSEVILQTFAAEARLEEEFKKCTLKLDEHITQSITNGTPVQNKKRPKRLGSLDDADEPEPEPESENRKSSGSRTSAATVPAPPAQSTQSSRKNSVRQKSLETAPAAVASASTSEHEESTSGRPARSARVKAIKNLKEPGLGHKMRQPSIVTVKQERISMEVRKERNDVEPMELDVENDGNVLNGVAPLAVEQKKSSDEGFGSTNEKEDVPVAAGAEPSREMSIMVIPQPILKVEVLSDDEAAEKMPPPSMPPPSKPATKSKAKSKKVKSSDAFPVPIKKEKDADDSAVSSAESTLSNASSVRSSSARAASKKKKESVQAPIVNIKKEKISTGKTKGKASNQTASPSASEKSVYEDALEGGDAVMKPLVVSIGKIPLADAEKNRTFAMDKNGTFTAANGTFVVPSPTSAANGTFNVKSPENVGNATFDVRQVTNSTFVMDNKKGTPEVNASIMTEDNSLVENSPEKPPVVVPAKKPAVAKKPQTTTQSKTKKNNELFSLQSPIKSRIEAFEKAAVASPMHTRTGTASSKHTTPSQPSRLPSKTSTTPLASQRFPSSAKASQHHTPTAQNNLPASKGISSSASKLAHLQKKPQTTSSTLTKSQSLSREPSMERQPGGTLSAASSSSSLANLDEKKKKREEKQRLAAQQREQMEKEKREHAERLMREKEEKHRKLVQEKEEKLRADAVKKARKMEEFEKRRHLEELNQRMLAEQKREELAKLEQQQRAEQADLFKMNQAKENYEIKLHKQMYQQKMQQQQKLAHAQALQLQQQQQQQQLQLKKKGAADKETFTFDMIETDDSTDDESSNTAPNKKTKRPPLPSWCSKEERRQPMRIQAEIKLKVIDQFFSVAPMTPDLREIFPAIDARKLKRNSSAVWRTPPRYSQMPKY